MYILLTLIVAMFSQNIFAKNSILGNEPSRAIYLNEATLFNESKLDQILAQSKLTKINSFVIDLHRYHKKYPSLLKKIKQQKFHITARIIVFPGGANHKQMKSKAYILRRLRLARRAKALGFDMIQLDYIRFSTKTPPSPANADLVANTIRKFKLAASGVPIEIAVFGEALHRPSKAIGQNLKKFVNAASTVAPMLYPSHYKPYHANAKAPYKTVKGSLDALQEQFAGKVPFKIRPYFEMYNIRSPSLNPEIRRNYLKQQIKAITDSKTVGWIAWSANNKYHHLFRLLQIEQAKKAGSSE